MKLTHVVYGTLFIGFVLYGCSKDTGPTDPSLSGGNAAEKSAIESMASGDEFVQNDQSTIDDQEYDATAVGTTTGTLIGDIVPIRYGRFITTMTKNVSVSFLPGDSLSIALVTRDIAGIFRIVGVTASQETVRVEKPFHDQLTRNIVFKRVGRTPQAAARNWVPVATSLVDGGTIPPNNMIEITSIEMFLPGGDTVTVTDPNGTYLRYRWRPLWGGGVANVPDLLPGQMVTMRVTVLSASPDTDLVAFRFGGHGITGRRARFHLLTELDNLDGTMTRTYEKSWSVPVYPGRLHAAIEAMTHQTVYSSDTTAYSVSWWAVPCRVLL